MNSKEFIFFLRIIGIILALSSIFFQLPNLIFGTMVKSVEDVQCEWWWYMGELIPHVFTIVVLLWFIIFQVKKMLHRR